jgi:hypothetical protein
MFQDLEESGRMGSNIDGGRHSNELSMKAPEKASKGLPRARKKAKVPARKKVAKASKEVRASELAVELAKMRSIVKEIGENLVTRMDADLAALALYLEGTGLAEEKPVLPPAGVIGSMMAEVKALKVKPHKGRVKDLWRVADLLRSLSSKMPPGV